MFPLIVLAVGVLAAVLTIAVMLALHIAPFSMTAQSTAIANIYEPAIWSKYFLEQTTAKSLLVRSGIAASSPELADAANQGGRTISMPFWEDLPFDLGTSTRSKVATDDDTAITPAGMTTAADIAVKHFRTQDFQASPIVKYVAGSDPVQMILNRYSDWWVREEQRMLLKILTGIFNATAVAAALSNDISGEVSSTDPARLINSDSVQDTRFLLGDQFEKLTAIIMHSVVYKRLLQQDMIDFLPESVQGGGSMPKYLNLNVLVDDGMTATAGSTSGYKYSTFLFGPGAIGRVDIPLQSGDPNVEIWREPKKGTGAGQVDVITRRYFILHPRGIAYGGSLSGVLSPSDADLATGSNWTQVYQTKNIRIARLVTNG